MATAPLTWGSVAKDDLNLLKYPLLPVHTLEDVLITLSLDIEEQ